MKKTAIITGSSRGIGFGIAKQLGEEGYNVVITATSPEEKNAENMAILKNSGISYLYCQGDISDSQARENIVKSTVEAFGGIHVLVNNAGVAPLVRADLLDMTEESFDRVVNINTKSNMFMSQLVAKQMLKQEVEGKKRGTIINVSSCSAVVSSISRGEYCVSKAGIAMLTKLFADRLAADSVFVHEIRPGVIKTDMTGAVTEKYEKLIADGIFPVARWGYPEDIANAVSVFCSDKFTYTTGNYIDVDGGFHIQRL